MLTSLTAICIHEDIRRQLHLLSEAHDQALTSVSAYLDAPHAATFNKTSSETFTYFGTGPPSLLGAKPWQALLQAHRQHRHLSRDPEHLATFTLE